MSVREIPVAIRAHAEVKRLKDKKIAKGRKGTSKEDLRKPYGKRVMVIDTETATDIYQNLLFGQAAIYEGTNQAYIDGLEKEAYLFYGDNLTEEDMKILREYAKASGLKLLSRQEFVDKVFWPEVWELGTLCVGFNLPFDLSRLAISVKTFACGEHESEFELRLSDSTYKPTILIKPIDSRKAFISLRFPTRPKRQSERIPFRQGRFLDLRTLVFALTNESHSLESACELYQVEHGKERAAEHGKITWNYLSYNSRDVLATIELYCKVKEEFDRHPITLEAGKAYSPASIGKAYYKAMGIKPFHEKQPDFPKEILGYAMAAYYGGRAECHYRGKPVKVFHTDVASMYPSVFTLQDLWSWVIAGRLDVVEATEEIKRLVDGISLEGLFNKEAWKNVPGLVLVKPDYELLPVRAEYGRESGYQIGLNYLTADKPFWYTLADVIACKLLTGKTPEIIKGLKIVPVGVQEGLQPVKIRGEIPLDPAKDNFFKRVIELRKEVKGRVKQSGDEADAMQLFLKILANSASYGVYIEINREDFDEEAEIDVYGTEHFTVKNDYAEINGRYYNPLVAVMITGAARLILAMIEKTVCDLGGDYAFCDTDSMSIIDLVNGRPEEIGKQVVEKFKRLMPYDFGGSLLEAEDYNWERVDWNKDTDKGNVKKGKYYPLYCYMVSAKRYVLYNLIPGGEGNCRIVTRKKSDHGLGHLRSPIEGKKNDWINHLWKRVISNEHNLPYEEPDWFYLPAFAQLSIGKPSIYRILNRDDSLPYSEQVKPFNFVLVAYPVEDKIFGRHVINKFYCRKYQAVGL
ncbi:MAG: DNA polymerase [Candidatus Bathyarchaeia archaeon]